MAAKYLPISINSLSRCSTSGRLLRSSSVLANTCTPYLKDMSATRLPVECTVMFSARHMGVFSGIKNKLGLNTLRFKRKDLHHAGMRLYLCSAELVDPAYFISEMDMPDTFDSWFRIMELHIWLVMVRLAEEGDEGKHARNSLLEFLWKDVDKRSKKLGPGASSSARRESVKQLSHEFKIALFSYDEGMLGDDRVLAGALWRTFFEKRIVKPEQLEAMVAYVRKQHHHLHSQNTAAVLQQGLVSFLPLYGDEQDETQMKAVLRNILRRT